ncbi:hypothetical protein OCU04_010362 [Sclerotinia nivalis]|uniref:RING-type domain-containing protein n=1 Tax=Sclerotinia nivalis TaxID=352851 RepID=A0A9X0AF87_9HELO|nr:hypothetical protein OCU04_010362 [Sclerotinia nivalis]
MSENIGEPSSSLSGQENEEQYTENEEYRLLRDDLSGDRLEYLNDNVPRLMNMMYQGSNETRSELDTQGAASSYESNSTTTPSPTSSVVNTEESFRENEEEHMLNEGAQGSTMMHEPSLDFSSHQFNFENSPPAHDPSSIMIPENPQQNEGLHTQSSQSQSSSAIQTNQQRRSELRAQQASRRRNSVSTTSQVASNRPISREGIQPYQGEVMQPDDSRNPFMPHTSSWRSRGALTDRRARLNGVSSNSSQTSEFSQMPHSVIDGPQANISLSIVDRTLPQRTNSQVAPMEARREVFQLFRDQPDRPGITRLEAVENDENAEINQVPNENNARPLPSTQLLETAANAEINQVPDANNARPLPSIQLLETAANAANEATGTYRYRPSPFLEPVENPFLAVNPDMVLEGVVTRMTISGLRNQHCYDIRVEWIKRLLISGNVNDSDACPICQENYTAPLEAPTNVRERHTCPDCHLNYTTTPNPGDAHDACAMPDCLHVFGRCCIIKWLKDKDTCPMCRATVDLP